MESKKNEAEMVSMLRGSEERLDDVCEEMGVLCIELAECEAENDQLFSDRLEVDNVLNKIANRVAMVESGYSAPDIAIEEIATILESIDK